VFQQPAAAIVQVNLSLRRAVDGRAGTRVVDEHDAVSHEYIILEPDAFADEGVRRSAAVTDNRTFWISTNVPMISVNAPIGPEQVYEIL